MTHEAAHSLPSESVQVDESSVLSGSGVASMDRLSASDQEGQRYQRPESAVADVLEDELCADDSRPHALDDSMSAKAIVRRTIWATVLLLVASLLASWFARDWLTLAGTYLIGQYGGRGVFTSVFFIDWIPIPATPEPIFLLGISAGMDMKDLFIATASGGVVAALGCYASGAVLERTTPVGEWVNRHYPGLVRWVETHGYKGLALAAIIPLPFSPMMWIAGIIGMPLERVVIISLLRIVKTAFYLYIIAIGWAFF